MHIHSCCRDVFRTLLHVLLHGCFLSCHRITAASAREMISTFSERHEKYLNVRVPVPSVPRSRPVRDVNSNPPQPWEYTTQEACRQFLEGLGPSVYAGNPGWCPGVSDEVLCWPAAAPGETVSQLCPRMQGVDPTKSATKTCKTDGTWWKQRDIDSDAAGYTDFEPCFTDETNSWLDTFAGANDTSGVYRSAVDIVVRARLIELVGTPISLACAVASLLILLWMYIRNLRSVQITLRIQLFLALIVMGVCRLAEVLDRHIYDYDDLPADSRSPNFDRLCKVLTVVAEYSWVAMYTWVFLEVTYMFNVVVWNICRCVKPKLWMYCLVGWGLPALLVTLWAPLIEHVWLVEERMHGRDLKCWFRHMSSGYYLILDVPRMCFIALSLGLLIGVCASLAIQKSSQPDTLKIRTNAKTTVALVLFLFVKQLAWMIKPSSSRTLDNAIGVWAFQMYVLAVLRAFEGLVVAVLYCALNGEVHWAVRRLVNPATASRPSDEAAMSLVAI